MKKTGGIIIVLGVLVGGFFVLSRYTSVLSKLPFNLGKAQVSSGPFVPFLYVTWDADRPDPRFKLPPVINPNRTNGLVGSYYADVRAPGAAIAELNRSLQTNSIAPPSNVNTKGTTVSLLFKYEYGVDKKAVPSSAKWFYDGLGTRAGFFIDGSSAPEIRFLTYTIAADGTKKNDDLRVKLDGKDKLSYDYYMDGNWHHFVFVHDAQTGRKEIWIDGELPVGFSKTATVVGDKIDYSLYNGGFYYSALASAIQGSMDELAFYEEPLPTTMIEQLHTDVLSGNHYSTTTSISASTLIQGTSYTGSFEIKDFHKGHALGSVAHGGVVPLSIAGDKTFIQQLTTYPLPRYKSDHTLHRNFNWADPLYAGGLFRVNSRGTALSESITANETELSKNWTYPIRLMVCCNPRAYPTVALANANPDIPTGIVLFRGTFRRATEGTTTLPFLPDSSYLQNSDGKFINEKNALVYQEDGVTKVNSKIGRVLDPSAEIVTTGGYPVTYDAVVKKTPLLQDFISRLTRPQKISWIQENAEDYPLYNTIVNGVASPGLAADTTALAEKTANGVDWATYSAQGIVKIINEGYKNILLSIQGMGTPYYTEYAIDGVDGTDGVGSFRKKYTEIRKLNSKLNNQYYSTGDFYPRTPNNWYWASGAWHGLYWFSMARHTEIKNGDQFFSPFISPGWSGNEERNIRPGQWLGLLKILVGQGAEFFYTGYFNDNPCYLCGPTYNEDGSLDQERIEYPSDPKGYAWQMAMPVYAQAVTSRIEDLFRNSNLMVGDFGKPTSTQTYDRYAFYAGLHNRVVVARKHKTKNIFLLAGTVQPYSNKAGNAPLQTNAIITLGGATAPATSIVPNEPLKFKIRRQGSMYIYDKTQNPPVFYQLDGWHEWSHPDWWSRSFSIEGELFDAPDTATIRTEVPLGTLPGDYTNFTSYALPSSNALQYKFTPRENIQQSGHVWLRARGVGQIGFKVNNEVLESYRIDNEDVWKWYKIPTSYTFNLNQENTIAISSTTGNVHLDVIFVSFEASPTLVPSAPMGTFATEITPPVTYQCSDGVDNDSDGYLDLLDPACANVTDDSELPVNTAPVSGGGGGSGGTVTPPSSGGGGGAIVSPPVTPVVTPVSTPENNKTLFERNLRIGIIGEDVKALQSYLNEKGFIVSSTGEGSPGNEIPNFGPKTRAALIKLQENYKEKILAPVNLNKGTGFFGPFSRGFVNEDIKNK
ncbi:hypothetical protein IT403_01915 [Candidatus Nomurabacteria bacterium]|nr:hypothetical protein [Candidatus Nomurabacteria bacterium]